MQASTKPYDIHILKAITCVEVNLIYLRYGKEPLRTEKRYEDTLLKGVRV